MNTRIHRLCRIRSMAAATVAGIALATIPMPVFSQAASGSGTIMSIEQEGTYGIEAMRKSILSFFEMYKAPSPVYPVRQYAVRFGSTDFDGSPVVIHARLFVPVVPETRLLPVYVFASGTTGIGDNCAPSLEQPETKRWGWYTQNMLAYASQGFIVMFPDYTGFNDPDRPQRYFSKRAEGRMMLDAIRAALSAFPVAGTGASPSKAVFTAGYSQGGHAAMAAADLRATYAPETPLAGVVTYGSTNDVEALVREGVAYAPLIFYSYLKMYGKEEIQPDRYLQDRWLPTFEKDASTMPVDEFQAYYGYDYKTVYRPEFSSALYAGALGDSFPALHARLTENHTGLSGHGLPALVVQGDADFIASTTSQTRFVTALRNKGSTVRYLIFPKVSHRYTRMAGFDASILWMKEQTEALGYVWPTN